MNSYKAWNGNCSDSAVELELPETRDGIGKLMIDTRRAEAERIAPLGEKHTIPRVSPIAATLSILRGGSLATLAQWPFLIHFGVGKLAIQQT
jgi:hypothetical protein